MPIETIMVVSAVILAFVVFGAALAWGSHITSNLPKN